MLKALNTHAVAIGGIIAAIIGLLMTGTVQQALGQVVAAFGGGKIDWPTAIGAIAALVGAIAAYFGRPHTIS